MQRDNDSIRVAVIGGGASGMMAAITAARRGAAVTVLEQNSRVGRKLLATGNGRCNFSNTATSSSNFHGTHPEFVVQVLEQFNVDATLKFFRNLGIVPKVEEPQKVFPYSNQASSILDVLRWEMDSQKVETLCASKVIELKIAPGIFTLKLDNGKILKADRVILAAGGKASPQLSSPGWGYALAQGLGHHVIEPFPALVPLKLQAGFLTALQGIKFNGSAAILLAGKPVACASGEILFTAYGISGPPILSLSRTAGEALRQNQKVTAKLTLIPDMDLAQLKSMLQERFTAGGRKTVNFSLVGFINKQLIPVVLKAAGIGNPQKSASEVTLAEIASLASILSDWRFDITGTPSWPMAQITAGGIDTREVEAATLESQIVPKVFFAGEILDVDGDCGGFNLQWAWSSGYVAGSNAARR